MPGPAFSMIFCSMGRPWANRMSAEKTVISATVSDDAGTSVKMSGTAPQMPTSIAVSQARPSSGGSPMWFMIGAKAGATASIAPILDNSSVRMAIGTVIRTSTQ
ncbi:hypothetical protein D3C78_1250560 [compost metagenome]